MNEKLISQKNKFDLIDSFRPTIGRIIFGSNGVGEGLWIGAISHFALYKDYVVPADLSNKIPFIEYDFSKFQDQRIPNLQAESYNLQVPHNYKSPIFKRFRRLSKWKKDKPGAISDVAINIFGFLPLGFAAYVVLLHQRIESRVILFGATCGVAFLLSLTIESLQVFLPSRHPSQIDLLCNSFGGFIAAFVAHFLNRSKIFRT